jgi:hypothetical protein
VHDDEEKEAVVVTHSHTQNTKNPILQPSHSKYVPEWILTMDPSMQPFLEIQPRIPRNPSTLNVASALRHASVGAGAETSCMKRRTTSR